MDTVYFTGELDGHPIEISAGRGDYISELNDAYVFVTSGPSSNPSNDNATKKVYQFWLGQSSLLAGSSFTGNQKFAIGLSFPCVENLEVSDAEYFRQFSGNGRWDYSNTNKCEQGFSFSMGIFCYKFYANGTGYYDSEPFTIVLGDQFGSSINIEEVSTTRLPNGKTKLDIELSLSANLYFNTGLGSIGKFGRLENGKLRIRRTID